MKKGKFRKPDAFKTLDATRETLKEKMVELELQKQEFETYLEKTRQQLEKMKDHSTFERESQIIRKDFGTECVRLRDALPVYAKRSEILEKVNKNKVCVMLGETGSGKSTQIPQYIYDATKAENGIIACTQPRKVAAISLATRVASEMASVVGDVVGYKVGMKTRKSTETKILYMTDHTLMNECIKDRSLSAYSCIIIDEAHERSIYTDLLLGMIKRCLEGRNDLRVIVTSATIDPDVFVRFFNGCPVLKISGRLYPVEVLWKEQIPGKEPFENYEKEAVQTAIEIHKDNPITTGDVLVFLTSPSETEFCCQSVRNELRSRNDFICFQLHGKIQQDEQQRIFAPTPRGKRKIVFATNSAETSITIPNIKYVIDTGLVKVVQFDPLRNLSTLSVTMVTKSSAEQRKGRAGRTLAGKCFRLYTEEDFEVMKPNNVPELLRINLSQGMLKLFELGVNPMDFEFVESPLRESMERSFELLEEIGAISQESITDLGKWISKLPIDPKFGAFVYEGINSGVGIEAITISACVSSGGSVFFRGGNTKAKDRADRIKTRFCHSGGDFMSYLTVFKEWHQVPEKSKGRWVMENCINGKVMKGIRETINEILTILQKELNKHVRFEFTESENSTAVLTKLLFKALKSNISHFLGHQNAGYLYIEKNQQLHLHPSSPLLALGCNPEWLVFLKVMRMARDHAKEVLHVSDDILREAIQEGWISVDIEEAKNRKIVPICTAEVGSQIFWEFVGPRFANLRNVETQFVTRIQGNLGIIEADKVRGEVRIYSSEIFKQEAERIIEMELRPLRDKLKSEESEQQLSQHTDKIRAVIGPGAAVQTIYMPHQFKTVDIFCSREFIQDISSEEVNEEFEDFGDIQSYWQRKVVRATSSMCFLGKMTFNTMESALAAVENTFDDDLQARSSVRNNRNDLTGFKAVLSWCRHRSKGHGYVELRHHRHIDRALRKGSAMIGGTQTYFQQSRNSDEELYIKNLREIVNEDVLRQGIAQALGIDAFDDVGKVLIVREKVETTRSMIKSFERRLRGKIDQFVRNGGFEVELRTPNPNDHAYIAYARFSDPEDGQRACSEINYVVTINGEMIAMKADLSTSIFVQKDIYEKTVNQVEECLEDMQENTNVRAKVKQLRNGCRIIDLHADSTDDLGTSKRAIHKLVRGEKLICAQDPSKRIIFTRNGRDKLNAIMDQTNTFITVDNRMMEITIHGKKKECTKAKAEIEIYLAEIERSSTKQVELKGQGKPVGVMKALLVKYGIELDAYKREAGLANVSLDLRHHKLKLTGTEEALGKGNKIISDVIERLSEITSGNLDSANPECVVCLTPVDDYDELYRLECCGHPYCKLCIELQMTSAVTNKDFPLSCCLENCETGFAWKDVLNLSRLGLVTINSLVTSSVSSFVAKNKTQYRYCITPDCPIVYEVSMKGICFQCPDCEIRICTTCHIQFHDGLTCNMYKSSKGDKGLAIWLRRDPERRKLCPSCNAPIEKSGGCNHMECASCRKHICWVCMQVFRKMGDCYAHLAKTHGSFG